MILSKQKSTIRLGYLKIIKGSWLVTEGDPRWDAKGASLNWKI